MELLWTLFVTGVTSNPKGMIFFAILAEAVSGRCKLGP